MKGRNGKIVRSDNVQIHKLVWDVEWANELRHSEGGAESISSEYAPIVIIDGLTHIPITIPWLVARVAEMTKNDLFIRSYHDGERRQ